MKKNEILSFSDIEKLAKDGKLNVSFCGTKGYLRKFLGTDKSFIDCAFFDKESNCLGLLRMMQNFYGEVRVTNSGKPFVVQNLCYSSFTKI